MKRLLVACAALLLAGAGLPGVGPGDPRVPVDANLAPWRAVGRVQTELGGRCTGFMIAPSVALTAAHCLYLPRVDRFIQPHSVHFVIGYASGAFAGHARAVSFVIAAGYDPRREGSTVGADWAVLQLDSPLGAPDRVLGLLKAPAAVGETVVLGGYDQDREELMEADRQCHVAGWSSDEGGRDIMRHDCTATSGTSGAPIVAWEGGRWIVVGLQVAATIGKSGGLAIPSFAIGK